MCVARVHVRGCAPPRARKWLVSSQQRRWTKSQRFPRANRDTNGQICRIKSRTISAACCRPQAVHRSLQKCDSWKSPIRCPHLEHRFFFLSLVQESFFFIAVSLANDASNKARFQPAFWREALLVFSLLSSRTPLSKCC